jgi:hypothetical protein
MSARVSLVRKHLDLVVRARFVDINLHLTLAASRRLGPAIKARLPPPC